MYEAANGQKRPYNVRLILLIAIEIKNNELDKLASRCIECCDGNIKELRAKNYKDLFENSLGYELSVAV